MDELPNIIEKEIAKAYGLNKQIRSEIEDRQLLVYGYQLAFFELFKVLEENDVEYELIDDPIVLQKSMIDAMILAMMKHPKKKSLQMEWIARVRRALFSSIKRLGSKGVKWA